MRKVERTTRSQVTVAAPPAKAHTLRALFMAGLAGGRSTLLNPLLGADQQRAIECLRGLGVGVEVEGDRVVVDGAGGRFRAVADELDVGESGVTMNFLTAAACLADRPVVVGGVPRLCERPIGEIVGAMRRLGCRVDCLGREGFPPIRVHGGGIPGGTAEMRGALMSQYFSALLTASPCADGPVTVRCLDEMTERPYLDITLAMMREFGVGVERDGYREFRVRPAGYAARRLSIEGDWSSAAFFFQAAAICGIEVTVTGLNPQSVQGDRRVLDLLGRMGCEARADTAGVTVTGRPLHAIEADMSDTPDLVPSVAVAAAFARGTTRLTGVGHLRHKECDRLAVICSELGKMGVEATCDADSLAVVGGRPHGARIDPHNDHRIAMSFAAAGLAVGGQVIEDERCVAKSFPDFWERLAAFG